MERLERQARSYRDRKRAEEAEREKLHAEIKRAAQAGMSHQAISDVLAGQGVQISRATVQRIATNGS
jgi:DNA-directed RNA polymerase specialized sigma54-like protein